VKNLWKIAALLSGAVLFGFAVERIGPGHVIRDLKAMSGGVVVILVFGLVRMFLQTRSWSIALRQDGIHSNTTELMFLRLASQGIGYLTVLGPVASEPIKIRLLERYGGSATAATLVDTGLYWLSAALVLIAGGASAPSILAHNQTASLLLALIAGIGIFALLRRQFFLNRLGSSLGTHSPGWLTKATRIESEVRKFACEHPAAIRQMFLLDVACQALLLAEVATALYFLHLPLRGGTVLSIEAGSRAVRMIGGWLPARIGADESGAAAVFAALGLPAAAGLALAVARRIRDMLNTFAGLTWLAWRARSARKPTDQTEVASPGLNGAVACKL
jgi:hypothetical protein